MSSTVKIIRNNAKQILALTEKTVKLDLRYKFGIILDFLTPIIAIAMPLLVMNAFFSYNADFGPWNTTNYLIYQFVAYEIYLLKGSMNKFPSQFRIEKYWKTFPVMIIAPMNRFNLLFGIFLCHLVIIAIPFSIFFIISYIVFPISFITAIFYVLNCVIIAIIFSGIGLILCVFAVSNENIWHILTFGLNVVFWLSCITYPYQIFIPQIQTIINLNPLYYIFDYLRLFWIEDNFLLSITLHPVNVLVFGITALVLPLLGVYIFNTTYKKLGIVGY